MRVLLQRVSQANVTVDGRTTGSIGPGMLLFAGIMTTDNEDVVQAVAEKVAHLRIFEDGHGRMNLSALDLLASGSPAKALVISQFTLYGDVRKGRRPSFTNAAAPGHAAPMIERFTSQLNQMGLAVEQGMFGAHMMVSLVNDGPVTIWIDSDDLRQPRRTNASDMP